MSNEEIRKAAREVVLARTVKRWNRIHPTGIVGKMLRPLFGSPKVEAIFVAEYEGVDDSEMLCNGEPLAAWCIDTNGRRSIEVDDVETGPVHGRIWHRQLVTFAVHANDSKVLVNEWDGPDNGRLIRYAVQSDADGIKVKWRGASPVLGGHSVG